MNFDKEQLRLRHEYFLNNGGRNLSTDRDIVSNNHEPCPTTSFGSFVTNEYALLRNLLRFLSCGDLIQSAQVCRGWLHAAEMELACRSLAGGSAWAGFRTVSPISAFQQWADSILHPTILCMWFSNEPLDLFWLRNADKKKFPLIDKLNEFLSILKTPLLSVVSDLGMIGTTSDLVEISEGPTFGNTVKGYASLLTIPKMQGVEVHQFRIKMIHARKIMEIDHKARPHWLLKRIKGPEKPIRCILFYINECLPIEPGIMFKALQNRQTEKLVIGGAFIMPYKSTTIDKKQFAIVGVAFYGENVEASSLALTLGHKTPEAVEERMLKFATGSVRGKVNLAFMFTCCGRGQACNRAVDRTNVDSQIFKQHFPTTPLHGVVGLGEIGCDWFPLENGIVQSKITDRDWLRTFVEQQYATVIIHLAFGLDSYEEHLQPPHIEANLAVAATLESLEESVSGEPSSAPHAGLSSVPGLDSNEVHLEPPHVAVTGALGRLEDSVPDEDPASELGPTVEKVFKPAAESCSALQARLSNMPGPSSMPEPEPSRMSQAFCGEGTSGDSRQ